MPKPITQNTLFYGDNLPILREHISDESVDLIYLDPPFNSNRSYNVLFKDESGQEAEAQITAFEDTWHWNAATEQAYHEMVQNAPVHVVQMLSALREFVGMNQMMAYLVMMAARLVELQRILKPTGSLYLHCDPTASHYLKIVLDTIFGAENFRNELIWKRQSAHSDSRGYGSVHDTILFYSKSDEFVWNKIFQIYDEDYVEQYYRYKDDQGRRFMSGDLGAAGLQGGGYDYEWKGIRRVWRVPVDSMQRLEQEGRIFYTKNGIPRIKRYLDEAKGMPIQDLLTDIESLRSWNNERLGYPTQKPLALLERIIQASSNEGNLVLDPFCGCGTAVAAAQSLKRRWIGIDITHLSISLMKYRLKDMFGMVEKQDYAVIGEPEDLESAHALAHSDRYQFQWWALSLVEAKPMGGTPTLLSPISPEGRGHAKYRNGGGRIVEGRKGSDRGIDGVISFLNEKNKTERILVQVKSGHVKSSDIRDLHGVVEREGAAMGVFLTLEEPSKDMLTEAVSAGYYHSALWQKDYALIQILTIEDIFADKGIDMPPSAFGTFKQADKVKKEDGTQDNLI